MAANSNNISSFDNRFMSPSWFYYKKAALSARLELKKIFSKIKLDNRFDVKKCFKYIKLSLNTCASYYELPPNIRNLVPLYYLDITEYL